MRCSYSFFSTLNGCLCCSWSDLVIHALVRLLADAEQDEVPVVEIDRTRGVDAGVDAVGVDERAGAPGRSRRATRVLAFARASRVRAAEGPVLAPAMRRPVALGAGQVAVARAPTKLPREVPVPPYVAIHFGTVIGSVRQRSCRHGGDDANGQSPSHDRPATPPRAA